MYVVSREGVAAYVGSAGTGALALQADRAARTADDTRKAASSGSSCYHTRAMDQPAEAGCQSADQQDAAGMSPLLIDLASRLASTKRG